MGALKKYRATVNGSETVLNLTEEDAKLYPDAQLVGEEAATETKVRRTVSDKARRPADK